MTYLGGAQGSQTQAQNRDALEMISIRKRTGLSEGAGGGPYTCVSQGVGAARIGFGEGLVEDPTA
jgi:hypothetical protein